MLSVAARGWVAFTVQSKDAEHKLALVLWSSLADLRDLLLILMRNKTFRNVKWCQSTVVRAADVLAPAPGQGKGQFPHAAAAPSCRTNRFFANAAARQGGGRLIP